MQRYTKMSQHWTKIKEERKFFRQAGVVLYLKEL
jgi:hypothetical protein